MKVRELLRDNRKWIKGFLAVTRTGNMCVATDILATRWCLLGAIEHYYRTQRLRARVRFCGGGRQRAHARIVRRLSNA